MDRLAEWTGDGFGAFVPIFVSAFAMFVAVTVATRLMGLRSFSKMSSTDFVTTVAVGSLIASVISAPDPSAVVGVLALLALFALKLGAAALRRLLPRTQALLDNEPIYLMRGETVLHDNLARAHVSVGELHAKLRQADVRSYAQVHAVVLETTGDVSVTTRPAEGAPVTDAIFAEVRG